MFCVCCFLSVPLLPSISLFFFFNDTATTEIYTLSLHDALPIWRFRLIRRRNKCSSRWIGGPTIERDRLPARGRQRALDRKSTRLNSSHQIISYAVFCLKKKKNQSINYNPKAYALTE